MSALPQSRRWVSPAFQFPPFRTRIEGKTRNGKVVSGTAQLVRALDHSFEILVRSSLKPQKRIVHAWCTHWRQP